MNSSPLIFLDLDGPMIPFSFPKDVSPFAIPEKEFPFHSKFDEKAKQFVADLCEEFDARIITNSTHNAEYWGGWEHILKVFRANNMFQWLESRTKYKNGVENRLEAVKEYLERYPTDKFVIFDDDYRDFPQSDPTVINHYVKTGAYGIGEKQYEKAREILSC